MENINEKTDFREYFLYLLSKSDIEIEDSKITQMLKFLELLYQKNQVVNLTAIRDKKGMLEKHFIDSLFLTKVINDTERTFIDVGTGAGFPGLVLAIFYPEREFLLVDSVRKKIEFINEVINELKLQNVNTSFERSEELIKNKRENFDVALCRGVANLRIILEYMIPFVKVNGRFLPQKLNLNEVEEAKNSLRVLNAKINKIFQFKLPESEDARIILEILKLQKTDLQHFIDEKVKPDALVSLKQKIVLQEIASKEKISIDFAKAQEIAKDIRSYAMQQANQLKTKKERDQLSSSIMQTAFNESFMQSLMERISAIGKGENPQIEEPKTAEQAAEEAAKAAVENATGAAAEIIDSTEVLETPEDKQDNQEKPEA